MTEHTQKTAKKSYAAPELVVHGDLRALTQGGSAGTAEAKSGGTGTNCGSNMKRKC